MNVGSLRNCNILIHQNINQMRERIPDLPAVYLVEPTLANFKQIAQDGVRNLYDYFIVAFSKPISASLMEQFAQELVRTNQVNKILRVTTEYLGAFQVITPDFFVLPGGEGNFKTLAYAPNEQETGRVIISKAVDHIANGLFCFFQALGVPPPLLKLKENDQLGLKVAKKLTELYEQTSQVSSSRGLASPSKRCVLILLDRFDDLQTMVYHAWTYLSLIQDVFGVKNNTIQYSEDANAPTKTNYGLDFDTDAILKKNAFLGFHEAGPNVDKELNLWKEESQKLNATQTSAQAISTALTNAMDALPQMTARKTKIDMHV